MELLDVEPIRLADSLIGAEPLEPLVYNTVTAPSHVLVTGASSGIGAALARRYAEPGVCLTLTGRNRNRLEDVALACRSRGAEAITAPCDVRDAAAMHTLVEAADERSPISTAIANAGLGGIQVIAGAAGESAETARDIFAINVMGVVNTIAPLLPRLVARGQGHVVIMSSLAAFVPLADAPAYSASKAAVRMYGAALRTLLAPQNVRVSVVCPGFVDTPMSGSLPGVRPFLWSAERAADFIVGRLARSQDEICFPWQLSMLARLSAHLPSGFVQRLAREPGNRPQ